MRHKKQIWLAVLAVIVALGVAARFAGNHTSAVQYFAVPIERGDIRSVVEATGTINAVTTVQVGSQVSGTIAKLNADFNSRVKKGEVVAQIDDSIFAGNLLQAQADLANAQANVAASRANLDKARATALQTRADYERSVQLTKEGVLSQQQLDLAKANADQAQAQVSSSEAQVTQAMAQVRQRQAAVSVARTTLDHTIIRAPIDGIVVNRNVDVGQTVAASLQAPTIFTIAQDLTKMQVYAKTDESDVGQIKPGQRVTFKVDAFPQDTFQGSVTQVRMNATTVQNVVTYDTIIEFANPDLKLFPGMTAYVTIPVGNALDTLKIPNGAIRFKPDMTAAEIRALYQKYGIETGGAKGRAAGGHGSGSPADATSATAGQNKLAHSYVAPNSVSSPATGRPLTDGAVTDQPVIERPMDVAIVWKLLPDNSIEPVQIKTGLTDHTVTQLVSTLKGDLKDGDKLVTGAAGKTGAVGAVPKMGQGGPARGK